MSSIEARPSHFTATTKESRRAANISTRFRSHIARAVGHLIPLVGLILGLVDHVASNASRFGGFSSHIAGPAGRFGGALSDCKIHDRHLSKDKPAAVA